MKPKSLCFTGEADCLVYPNYRYSSLLRPALVTGKRLNYLPTVEGEEARGGKKQKERHFKHGMRFLCCFFFLGYEQGKINDQWTLNTRVDFKAKGIPEYSKWKIRMY